MWVHPSFKKTIKKKAVDKDTNVIEFTKNLAEDEQKLKKVFLKGFEKINENFGKLL